jgi:tRNA (guanine37-N1)-methyltransferase
MSFRATILTLYPEMFPGFLGQSLSGKASSNGVWSLETIQIRDFATGKHRNVDDTPAGGGAGMVMRADVLARAIDSVQQDGRPRILLSPRGKPLTQAMVREWSKGDGIVLVCGRFEGVDQRAIVRILPGVMGNEASGSSESFENGLLEYPHYTRPQTFEGVQIPEVLTSGNHAKIEEWRRERALELTKARRPDLLARKK